MSEIIRLSKAVSRAELVQWLIQSGEGADSLLRVADFAGFAWQEKPLLEVEKTPKEKKWDEDKQIPLVQFEDKPPIPVLPQAPKAFNARWFRVAKRERLSQQDDNNQFREPLSIQGIEDFSAQDLQPDNTPLLALAPLLRWERLWPVLKRGFSSTMLGAIDIPCLVGQVARGGMLESLPRQQRQHWAAKSLILLDYNPRVTVFWDDFNRLVVQLKQLRGGAGLHVLKQQGLPGLRYVRWRDKDKRQVDWVMPAPETPILILSDLGMLEPSSTLRKHWLRFGRELKAAGLQPFVLAPVSPQHIDTELSRYYHIALWDRSSHLLSQKQRAKTDDKERLEQLLVLLSPTIRIEPELLRAVRHLLADTAFDAGVEAEFWQHPAVEESSVACALRSKYVETYRQQFKEQPLDLQREVLKLIRQHHAHLFPSVMHYETLLWSVLAAKPLVQEFNAEIEQAELFLRKTAKMLYTRREYLDDSRKAYGKRALDNADKELLCQHLCLTVFEGVVNAEQAAKGLPLRPGIDRQELERTLARGRNQTRKCVLYQHGDELMLAAAPSSSSASRDRGVGEESFPGSPIANITLTNDALSLQLETMDGQQSGWYFQLFHSHQAGDGLREWRLVDLGQNIHRLILTSGNETLNLQSLTKPDWAQRIGRDVQGLWVEFTQHSKDWRIWWPEWGGDLGYDDYGLFLDLNIKGITQRCRWIVSGTFLMGSPESEKDRVSNETQHKVTLTQGYWLADTTCTQALWETVMGNNPANFKDDKNNPVEQVSWDDTQKFFKQLNKLIPGLDARLPIEAQWEYACRAGTTTPFSFGKNITPAQVNYDGNYPYSSGKKGLHREKTITVKSLPANSWGLYEMHGNVYEWCQDWLGDYPAKPVIDPLGAETGSDRVLRGGSWSRHGRIVRSSRRSGGAADDRSNNFGFRFVLGQTTSRAAESHNWQERIAHQQTTAVRGGDGQQRRSERSAVGKLWDKVKPRK